MADAAEKTRKEQKPKRNRVIVFSTPTCSYCNMAKHYFRRNKIRFKDVDVSRDQAAARDLVARDPDLARPEHARIKARLEARYRDRLEMFGVG